MTKLLRRPWVIPVAIVAGFSLIALGYWRAWVWAAPSGLRVLGIDLAEYVKFLAEVRSSEIRLQRELFYLPLLALSISLSLLAHRHELSIRYSWLRWLFNLLALPVALAMLPPAWTPFLLMTPEFMKQTLAMAVCAIAALLSYPLLRRLPLEAVKLAIVVMALSAILWPVAGLHQIRPALDSIYGRSVAAASPAAETGPVLMALGLTLLALGVLFLAPGPENSPGARPNAAISGQTSDGGSAETGSSVGGW